MTLLLVLSPNLKTSSMKASRFLEEASLRFDTLLLNLPMEMEEEVAELVSGSISADEFVDEARQHRMIPEPVDSWEYSAKPILEALPRIIERFPYLSTHCYGSSKHEFASIKLAVKVAKLTLRTILTERVEVEEWRETLLHSLEVNREARESEVEAILERVGRSSVCVSDMGGRGLRKSLQRHGIPVKIHYVERPYHFTPLMVLENLIAKRFVMDEEIERLVGSHLEYIRSYVYRFDNRDRAYYEWVYDKVPWLREKIYKEEIEVLDNIIHRSRTLKMIK